jgi:major membrane immunogen (membrane-anchored lipoprotein)
MKNYLLIASLLLSACSSLQNFQEQPVVPYGAAKTYKTTCSGLAEDWGSCHRKAKKTCPDGYQVANQNADSNGVHRVMVFSCK